jgi:hypothetical protein
MRTRDSSVAIANTLARRNEICTPCHQVPQVLFIRGVAERFGANEFFGASITRDTIFETCLLERITAQRPSRFMHEASKQNDWTAPTMN